MGHAEWRRIAGFRVVMSWPERGFTPPPTKPSSPPSPLGQEACVPALPEWPEPFSSWAGPPLSASRSLPSSMRRSPPWRRRAPPGRPGKAWWLSLRRSLPVSVEIPAIGVHSVLLRLGVKPDGAMQVPPLQRRPSAAGWYKYSVTPGQIGTSVIEGHVDSEQGPAVFFRLGALRPGDLVNVRLADGITAIFRVTGVRQYLKSRFPAKTVYRDATRFAALRLITCGGAFDYATSQYLSSTVVFAFLVGSRPADHG